MVKLICGSIELSVSWKLDIAFSLVNNGEAVVNKTLPTTEESKCQELNYVREALTSNGYPQTLISRIIKTQTEKATPSPEELVRTFFESVEPTTSYNGYATLPYIKGVTEPISITLRKHDIKAEHVRNVKQNKSGSNIAKHACGIMIIVLTLKTLRLLIGEMLKSVRP